MGSGYNSLPLSVIELVQSVRSVFAPKATADCVKMEMKMVSFCYSIVHKIPAHIKFKDPVL